MIWSNTELLAIAVGPLAMAAMATAVGSQVAQSGWVFTTKPLQMNWNKLNPSNGLQRFKPQQGGVELLKSVVSVVVVLAIGCGVGYELVERTPELVGMMPVTAMRTGWDQVWTVLWRAGLALVVIGGGDYAVQRWRVRSSLKMTKQEVKDEARQQDGNPEIKARVRRVQREMARQRMIAAVKKATVVVTNPTHYAVALEYRRASMAAPVVVAKGQDSLAARIRAEAREHGVPIVENPPLARAIHKSAEVGDMIPAALFSAVAEVLAYLVRIKQLML